MLTEGAAPQLGREGRELGSERPTRIIRPARGVSDERAGTSDVAGGADDGDRALLEVPAEAIDELVDLLQRERRRERVAGGDLDVHLPPQALALAGHDRGEAAEADDASPLIASDAAASHDLGIGLGYTGRGREARRQERADHKMPLAPRLRRRRGATDPAPTRSSGAHSTIVEIGALVALEAIRAHSRGGSATGSRSRCP